MINAKEAGKRMGEVRREREKTKRQALEQWMEQNNLEATILNACEEGLSWAGFDTKTCPDAEILIEFLRGLGYEVKATLIARNGTVRGICVKWREIND